MNGEIDNEQAKLIPFSIKLSYSYALACNVSKISKYEAIWNNLCPSHPVHWDAMA
jgi:hypothetical protein